MQPLHYAGLLQGRHHEIECYWVTTFDDLRDTSFVVGKNDRALQANSSSGKGIGAVC
jgi:hypothetical protein